MIVNSFLGLSHYGWELVVGFSFLVVYVLLVLWARSVYIARANRVWTDAHGDALLAGVGTENARSASRSNGSADKTIERLLGRFGSLEPAAPFRWQLNWNGSKEIGDWVRLHEAQQQAVWHMDDQVVLARFERAMGQLDELPQARRQDWRQRWSELNGIGRPAGDARRAGMDEFRSHLVELLSELHNTRDAKYAQLASLYGKAMWLIGAALLPLAVLITLGYGVILVAGAIGGLISRLQRLVYAEGLPTAYGSSWVPLFCAPLLGALAAWAGLNMVYLLQALGVVDLKAVLIPGGAGLLAPTPQIIGFAVLFGLSERFLNKIGSEAARVVDAHDAPPASQDRRVQGLASPAARRSEPVPRPVPSGGPDGLEGSPDGRTSVTV